MSQGDQEEAIRAVESDRISTLPDHLIHHIMSLLPTKDIAKTAVLSKRWESLWQAYPHLDFYESSFRPLLSRETCRRKFCDFLRRCLTYSYRHFNHLIRCRICTAFPVDYQLTHLVNRCVATAILRGQVQKLQLKMTNPPANSHVHYRYVLPRVLFSSGSFLVNLVLEDCDCGSYNKVSFPSLKTLAMRYVNLSNRLLERIIKNSPQIDTMRIDFCYGFDILKVFNSQLKSLVVIGFSGLLSVEMHAPKLNYFKCYGFRRSIRGNDIDANFRFTDYDCGEISEFKVSNAESLNSLETLGLSFVKVGDEVFKSILSVSPKIETLHLVCSIFGNMPSSRLERLKSVEVRNCRFSEPLEVNAPNLENLLHKGGNRQCILKHVGGTGFFNLKSLSLERYIGLTDQSLQGLLSWCRLLENLGLRSCGMLNHMKVISSTLKSLVVKGCLNVQDGEIQAPNLEYFEYLGEIVVFSPIISSKNLNVELHLQCLHYEIDLLRLSKLTNLLQNLDQAKVLKIFSNGAEHVILPEGLASPSPARVCLPYLRVHTRLFATTFLDFLLGVLRISFHHENLWITLGHTTIKLKFQLTEEPKGEKFSLSEYSIFDCIKDHLIEVTIEEFDGGAEQMELLTYLLDKAQILQFICLSFNKELTQALSDNSEIIYSILNHPKASRTALIFFT